MKPSFEYPGKLGKEFIESGLESISAVSQDAQAITAATAGYAKKMVEAGNEAMGRLMVAGSLESAIEIQSDYFRRAYEGFVAEATQLGGLYADMAKDAYRPFEAIVVRSK